MFKFNILGSVGHRLGYFLIGWSSHTGSQALNLRVPCSPVWSQAAPRIMGQCGASVQPDRVFSAWIVRPEESSGSWMKPERWEVVCIFESGGRRRPNKEMQMPCSISSLVGLGANFNLGTLI